MPELKPCPFCGGEAEIDFSGSYYTDGSMKGYVVAKCTCCTASVIGSYYRGKEITIPLEETKAAFTATQRWNLRKGE